MSEAPVDMSSIDPDNDSEAADRFVSSVMSRIATRERQAPPDALIGVWMLSRPLLVAASMVIAVLVVEEFRIRQAPAVSVDTVAEAVGIPPQFLARMDSERGGIR